MIHTECSEIKMTNYLVILRDLLFQEMASINILIADLILTRKLLVDL